MTTPAFSKTVYIPKESTCEVSSDHGEFRAVQNQNVIQLVAVKDTRIVHYTSADTSGYAGVAKGNPARLEPWIKNEVVKDSSQSQHSFTTGKRLGLVAVQGKSYLFWVDSLSGQVLATALTPSIPNAGTDWCLVTDANGQALSVNTAGVTAMAGVNDGDIILTYLVGANSTLTIQSIKLEIADYNGLGNVWPSTQSAWTVSGFSTAILPNAPSRQDGYWYENFGITTLLVPQTVMANQTVTPVNTVVAAIWLETHDLQDGDLTTFYYAVNADASAQQGNTVTGIPWHQNSNHFYRDGEGINLSIDPAGRILAVFGDANNGDDITIATLPRISDFLPNATNTDIGWTDRATLFNEDTEAPISTIYTVCATPNADKSYPIIVGAFWVESAIGNGSKVMMGSMHYCDFKIDSSVIDPEPGYLNTNLLEFVCDPFPMPLTAPYVWVNASPDGMADWTLVQYEVLNGKDHNITHEVNATFGFGFRGEWKGSIGSWGVQFNGHVLGGGMWHTLDLDAKWEATSIKMQTKGFPNPYFAWDDPAPYLIRPYSAYFGRTLFSLKKLTGTALNVACKSDSDRFMVAPPLYFPSVNPDRADSVAGDMFAYACTPGDVSSYTEAKINAQMLAMFLATRDALSAGGQSIYDIFKDEFGNDLTHFYTNQPPPATGSTAPTPTSNNYVQDVVTAFGDAMSITGAKYVCINFSGSVVGDGQYRSNASNTSGSGGFLNGSFYGGFGGDSGYLQMGFEFSVSKMNSTQDATTFGIGLKSYLNTMAPTQAMTARLYLLKASRLWALEAQYFPTHARDLYLQRLTTMRDHIASTNALTPLPADAVNLAALDGITSNADAVLYSNSKPRRAFIVVSQWDSGPQSSQPLTGPTTAATTFPMTASVKTVTGNRYLKVDGSNLHSYQGAGGGSASCPAIGGTGPFPTYRITQVGTTANGVAIVTLESIQYPKCFLRTDGSNINLQYSNPQGMEFWEVVPGPNGTLNIQSAYKTAMMLVPGNGSALGLGDVSSTTFCFTLVSN